MAGWREMSEDCLRAAKVLAEANCLRRSVSSSYYAAYCAAAGVLSSRRLTYARGWKNPPHDQLTDYIRSHTGLSTSNVFTVNRTLRRLRAAREDADYRPGVTIDESIVQSCLRDATLVIYILENDI